VTATVGPAPASLSKSSHARRLGRRAPRWLRIALGVLVSAFVVYLLAANVILRTALLRGWIGEDESKLKVAYSSAWSLYPGHVAVRDLSLRYQDSNVQMLIAVERATLRVDLFALTKRTLRVSRLNAEGTTFRIRQKVETVLGREARVSSFPPIEGFADPPIEHKVPKRPTPDEQYKLWTIDLPDVVASLREVWTMEFRYRGEGAVRGGFYLKPERNVWVLPSIMRTHGGVFSLGNRDVLRGGEGRLDVQIAPSDVRGRRGIEVLRHLSGGLRQRGELVLPSIAMTYLPRDTTVDVARGSGIVTIDIEIDRGVLRPGTRVSLHADEVVVNAPSISVQTDLDLVAHVETSAGAPTVLIEMAIAHATGTPLDVRDARAMIELENANLAGPFGVARASGAVTSAHSTDLRAWQPFAPENTSLEGGSATLAARAQLLGGALEGRLDLALDEARMTIGPLAFVASGKAWTNLASEDIEKALAFPGTGAELRDIALRLPSAHAEGLWMRSTFANAKLSTAPPSFDADIDVDSGPGDRTLELFTRLVSLPEVAAGAASDAQLAASLHLRIRPGLIALAVTEAKNGALESRGSVQKRTGSETSGAFLISVGPFHAGLDLHGSGVSVVPFAGGAWLDEKLQQR
jgi:hypothetical protein